MYASPSEAIIQQLSSWCHYYASIHLHVTLCGVFSVQDGFGCHPLDRYTALERSMQEAMHKRFVMHAIKGQCGGGIFLHDNR